MTTRRRHGSGGLRQRGDRWQSYARLPRTGRVVSHTWPAGTGRRDAERLHRSWLVEVDSGTVDRTITVEDWLTRWVDLRAGEVSDATLDVHRRNVRRILPALGRVKLADLTGLRIKHAFDELDLSPASLSSVKSTLNGACRDAVDWRIMPSNPVAAVRLPKRVTADRAVPTTTEVHAIVNGEPIRHWAVYWACLTGTGCRPGELLGATWGQVDLQARTVWIDRTLTVDAHGKQTVGTTTKTGRGRRIAIGADLAATLASWRAELAGRALSYVAADAPLFPSHKSPSGTLTSAALLVAWRRALKRIGAENAGYTPHSVRHWFASTAIQRVPVPILAAHMGHSQSELLDRYGRWVPVSAGEMVVAAMPFQRDDTDRSTAVC